MPAPLPVPNSTLSFWRANLDPLDDHRTTEALPVETDILIIGAGYAGASTAYHILEKSKGASTSPSIVILEARAACSGATGRNGGHLKPDPYVSIAAHADEDGVEAAAEVAQFEADHVPAIAELVEKENIDCDFVVTRAMDVPLQEDIRDQLKSGREMLAKAGVKTAKETFYSPQETAEGISGVKGAKGCFSYTAGHIYPYKMVLHLLRLAISRGVNLQTHTPVTSISSSLNAAGQYTITTSRGSINAKTIVFATNAYTSSILPEYKDKIIPVRGTACRIVTPSGNGKRSPYLPNSYIIRQSGGEYDYLIPRADGSIVVGGGRSSYADDLKNWYDNADDSKILDSTRKYFDGYMQRTFFGWEDSGAHIDKIWTGIMGYSSDYSPHIGLVPNKPGQYILAGFTGHGMPQAYLSAKGIASMIVEKKSFKESGVPRIWQTSQKRLDSKRNRTLEGGPLEWDKKDETKAKL